MWLLSVGLRRQPLRVGRRQGSFHIDWIRRGIPRLFSHPVIAFSIANCKWQAQVLGLKLRTAIWRLIYHNCLFLPVDSLDGVISPANLMSVDAERYFSAMNAIIPPIVYLVGIYPLLLIEFLGWVAAAVCVVSAVASTAMQQVISKRLVRASQAANGCCRQALATDGSIHPRHPSSQNEWLDLVGRGTSGRRAKARTRSSLPSARFEGGQHDPGALVTLRHRHPGFLHPTYSWTESDSRSHVSLHQRAPGFAALHDEVAAIFFILRGDGRSTRANRRFSQTFPASVSNEWLSLILKTPTPFRSETRRLPVGGTADAPSPWASPLDQQTSTRKTIELGPLTLHVGAGEFCLVCGPVGSGKSSLLLGMLGELSPSTGEVSLVNDVALCGQEPWMLSASLRDNVVCLRAPDEKFYQGAVVAAQLLSDFETLPAGDDTEIGPRGINISGGQKARVALSRALFGASAKVVLLDDVL